MTSALSLINVVRDNLRTNLTDPITLTSGSPLARTGSNWIFADEPNSVKSYPMIELEKVDNPTTNISIGPNYTNHEMVFINIWCYVKNGFTITTSGVSYKNAQVVEYMLNSIKTTLKAQFSSLNTNCAGGFRVLNSAPIEYDPDTQLYYSQVSVRVWYFWT